jgi:hypothetical protein
LKTTLQPKFWRRTDNSVLFKTLVAGLALGITVRWMALTAPPLPVWAQELKAAAAATNTPALFRSEGASPSGRN